GYLTNPRAGLQDDAVLDRLRPKDDVGAVLGLARASVVARGAVRRTRSAAVMRQRDDRARDWPPVPAALLEAGYQRFGPFGQLRRRHEIDLPRRKCGIPWHASHPNPVIDHVVIGREVGVADRPIVCDVVECSSEEVRGMEPLPDR